MKKQEKWNGVVLSGSFILRLTSETYSVMRVYCRKNIQ